MRALDEAGPGGVRAASPPPLARTLTLLVASALTVMAGATIAPSLPAIEAHFQGVEQAAILSRLVLTLPAIFIALGAPLAGLLADRFGRLPLLRAAILLYAAAGLSGLVAETLPGLLLGRAALGIAVAGIMTASTALVGDYFAGSARDRFMGLQAAFFGFGGVVFLTSGGLLAEWHWRAPFGVYAAAFAVLPAAMAFLIEPPRHASTPAAGRRDGPGRSEPIGLALAGVLGLAVLNSVAFYLVPVQLPFLLRGLGTTAPSLAGLAIGTATLTSALAALAYARLRVRIGILGVFAAGFGLMGAGYWLVAAATSYQAVLPALAVAGVGMGLVMPNLGAAAMSLAPPAARGRVAGGLTAGIFIGHFLSPLASQPWIAFFGYAAAFRDTAVLLGSVAAIALMLALDRGKK